MTFDEDTTFTKADKSRFCKICPPCACVCASIAVNCGLFCAKIRIFCVFKKGNTLRHCCFDVYNVLVAIKQGYFALNVS